ncbi:unnamed protein product [Linum trigynum]|uniref:Uncharacterized protein n=1 Tax=Linum trigynum TaxID=586398 RepID=A0AAV2F9L0_9ROSI
MLLTAVGKDGNNQMFPIAWVVVEGENRDSWSCGERARCCPTSGEKACCCTTSDQYKSQRKTSCTTRCWQCSRAEEMISLFKMWLTYPQCETFTLNRANGIQDVRLNVADRRTIERELRVATTGVGVYVDERTGNQYVRLNGARGRAFDLGPSQQPRAVEANVVELGGSQPPPSQP